MEPVISPQPHGVCGRPQLGASPSSEPRHRFDACDADPHKGLVVTKMWSFNNDATGAARTEAFRSDTGSRQKISDLASDARTEGAVPAFASLHTTNPTLTVKACKLKGLATAFGTKLLYFYAYRSRSADRPLIMDRFSVRGLFLVLQGEWSDGLQMDASTRSPTAYGKYLDRISLIASATGTSDLDRVEYWLWMLGRTSRPSRWV